jgi:isocitrate dehydrogenase
MEIPRSLVIRGMEGAIAAKTVTYDFHRLLEGATKRRLCLFHKPSREPSDRLEHRLAE